MRSWFESVAGPEYASALMWTIAALVMLLVLLVLIRIVRSLTFGTFVAGGRNRKARLAVMDAAAVDSHRRLVLVRRDDVEHLILIGGPSDVVVEQNIRLLPPARRPAAEEAFAESAPMAAPAPAAAPVVERSQPAPVRRPPPSPAAPSVQAVAPTPMPSAPALPPQPAPATAAPPAFTPPPVSVRPAVLPAVEPRSVQPAPVTPPARAAAPVETYRSFIPRPAPPVVAPVAAQPEPEPHDLDDALLDELEVTLEKDHKPSPADVDRSLDEEMSKLLGELSGQKR